MPPRAPTEPLQFRRSAGPGLGVAGARVGRRHSKAVSIPACHAGDPGSIPGDGVKELAFAPLWREGERRWPPSEAGLEGSHLSFDVASTIECSGRWMVAALMVGRRA